MTSTIDSALRDLRVERVRLADALRDTEIAITALEQITRSAHQPASAHAEPKSPSETGARSSGGKALVLRAFREVGEPMDTDRVIEAITERGWRTGSDDRKRVIATTLSKLVREEKLAKVSPNTYALVTRSVME